MNVRLCLQRFTAMLLILIAGICGMPELVPAEFGGTKDVEAA